MRATRAYAIAAVVLLCHIGAHAAAIVSVTAANPGTAQDLRLDANSIVAVHWTLPASYGNVSVSAKLSCTPCSGKNDAAYADAYLMTQIGPLATASVHQIAYVRVKVTGTRSLVNLFSGLTLAAGDYYLVIYSATQAGAGSSSEPAVAWGGTAEAGALVTAATGVTREAMLIYANNGPGPLINSAYPPASYFTRVPTTPAYDVTGAYTLEYEVTTTPSTIVPHVVSGGGWKTKFVLMNLSADSATYNIRFRDDNGNPLQLALVPSPAGTLPAGGVYFAETPDSSPSIVQASAEIISSGKIGVSVGLRQAGANGTYQEATLAGMTATAIFNFVFDNVQGTTAIALANANGTASLKVVLSAQAENGKVAEATIMLPPRGHSAFPLTAVLPSFADLRGALRISAPSPDLAAMVLRFDPKGFFTTTPPLY